MKLNETELRKLSTDKPRQDFIDDSFAGFGVRVTAGGKKTFFYRFGPRRNRERKYLGVWGVDTTLTEARDAALDIRAEYRRGDRSPHQPPPPTYDEWAAAWLDQVEHRKKRPESDRRFIRKTRRRWKALLLNELTRDHVTAAMRDVVRATKRRHESRLRELQLSALTAKKSGTPEKAAELEKKARKLADRTNVGNTQANRFLASIRACLQEAVDAGNLTSNPAAGIKQYRENPPRSRTLSATEMKRLLAAIGKESDPHVRTAFLTLVQTGARLSEVLRAQWDDFDLEEGLWRIPSPKAGIPQTMPIAKQTIAMLRATPKLGPWLVPGKDTEKHRVDLVKPWRRIVKTAKIEDVTIHDIRRTFGLEVAKTKNLHVASKLLRHTDVRVTERIYAPLDIEDLREGIEGAQRQQPAEVVDIKEGRR